MKRKRLWTFLLFCAVIFCFAVASIPYFRSESPQSTLELHFIDVGQGDASLILCGEHAMLIDGGTAKNSSRIYTYLQKHGVEHLDYIVATHPHDDHVGGLAGALNYASVDVALSPVTQAEGRAFESFVKYLNQQNVTITVPKPGDVYSLGEAELEVLGPMRDSPIVNDISLVLRIRFGSFSAIFTGDAGAAEEADIMSSGHTLRSDLLKVGHHGGSNASSEAWIQAVSPKIAVISCGRDNDYGHPAAQTLSRLESVGAEILRTDTLGDIVITVYPDGTVQRFDSTQPTPDTVQADADITYIINTRTGKFHDPSCSSAAEISPGNRLETTANREDLLSRGYEPCGKCRP